MSSIKYYSLRLLSPFRGMLQLVELPAARAMSEDGFEWQLQVRVESRNPIWAEVYGSGEKSRFMVFGTWNEKQGLVRLPFDPMADVDDACQKADEILALLPEKLRQQPFPYEDKKELWLLDQAARPLALLASIRANDNLPVRTNLSWSADSHKTEDLSDNLPPNLKPDTALLTKLVNQAGRPSTSAQWFLRNEDGTGEGRSGINLEPQWQNRVLGVDDFPEMMLRTEWQEEKIRKLVDEYICWSAPRLLTLQTLSDNTRDRLEKMAVKQALQLEKNYRLYPKIINPDLIDGARVEAQIRAS